MRVEVNVYTSKHRALMLKGAGSTMPGASWVSLKSPVPRYAWSCLYANPLWLCRVLSHLVMWASGLYTGWGCCSTEGCQLVSACVCVCMCVYACMCMFLCVYAHVDACISMCVCACVCVWWEQCSQSHYNIYHSTCKSFLLIPLNSGSEINIGCKYVFIVSCC